MLIIGTTTLVMKLSVTRKRCAVEHPVNYGAGHLKWTRRNSTLAINDRNCIFGESVRDGSTVRFLRPQKSYEPPADSSDRIDKIRESQTISVSDDTQLEDAVRFKLFTACEEEFKYSIPNSLLHTIGSIADLKQFYSTPVDSTTPYEAFHRLDLPKNLHIQQEYHRFHPDTDTMFGGVTAFPKSSTIVTGLKYKKKYPGHKQENPWLSEMMKI
ncbi:39S ribosomal protein L50, mitochondrial isoform X1 [Ooceraea biroi]|uniref:39S ribosomal protein L50, mitochondrial isoform X1 n=1 Tax=Ooceraea biroi TaxID=2015173 RepID=UPI0005BAD9EF|nr:39S ribosomal protein L50, mitochondrial isoform X1 [Ooceraea biroi]